MTLAERTAIVRDGGLIESIDSECNQQKQETASPPVGSLLSLYTYAVVHIIYIVIYIYINIYIKRSFSRILSSFFCWLGAVQKEGRRRPYNSPTLNKPLCRHRMCAPGFSSAGAGVVG